MGWGKEITSREKFSLGKGKLYRKIILAGDDITFICNVEVALLAAETILKDIATRYLYEEKGQDEVQRQQI